MSKSRDKRLAIQRAEKPLSKRVWWILFEDDSVLPETAHRLRDEIAILEHKIDVLEKSHAELEAERNAWKAVAEECKAYIVFSAIWDSILDDYGLLEGGDDE